MYLIKGLLMFFSKSNTRDDTDEPNKEYKKAADITSAALVIYSQTFLFLLSKYLRVLANVHGLNGSYSLNGQ